VSTPGPAIVGVDQVGVVQVDVTGAVTTLAPMRWSFQDAVTTPSGDTWLAAIGGLWRVAGGKAETVPTPDKHSFEHLALGPDGVLWAVGIDGVSRWDGKAWTLEPRATFGGVTTVISDLTVDAQGRVWVVSTHALWRRDGDRWSKLEG